jgi:deoxyxylulose-5-phosphate synthase
MFQLYRLHYYGIVDTHHIDWYTTTLEHLKSLDMNDFLHVISPYVVNLPIWDYARCNL